MFKIYQLHVVEICNVLRIQATNGSKYFHCMSSYPINSCCFSRSKPRNLDHVH